MSIYTQHQFKRQNFSLEGHNVTERPWLLDITAAIADQVLAEIGVSNNTEKTDIGGKVTQVFVQSTTEFAQNLQDITTRLNTISVHSFSQPEVTIVRPEVRSEIGAFGTAEKVVIGAAAVVVCLAIIGILLRVLGPYFRSKKEEKGRDVEQIFQSSSDLVASKLSLNNFGCESVSQSTESGNCSSQDCSQSSGSSPATDWSELSKGSSETQSSSSLEEDMFGKQSRGFRTKELREKHSMNSLPGYINDDRGSSKSLSKGSPSLHRKPNDEQVSVISTQSLEPLRLEQNYRNRWDDQFDPSGSLPRGNLSHHSHPSESRLSQYSTSTVSHSQDSPTFPIPSRDFVRQLHMDKERRYPSNTTGVKKEKHVRMSPPYR